MTTDFSELVCGQANCPVNETGKCLEGVVPPTSIRGGLQARHSDRRACLILFLHAF
jgi:hypothetical protein